MNVTEIVELKLSQQFLAQCANLFNSWDWFVTNG